MRKFRLALAALLVVSMYACNDAAAPAAGTEGTAADSTHTHTDGESHEGHNH